MKFYGDEATDSHDKEMPKVESNRNFLSVIILNSCLMKYENYYLQVFLKECKYIKKKVIRHITDDLEVYSDDYDEEKIKTKYQENVFFRRALLKISFLRQQLWKHFFWGSNSENVLFKEQFWGSNFEKT